MRDLGALLVVLIVSAVVLAPHNGASRPLERHEIFVAETASEMVRRADYLVPHFNGDLRLEKPPLSYWLSIVSHELVHGGDEQRISEFEARLPSLLSAVLLLAVTCASAGILFSDRRVGLLAAGILATSWQFFRLARSARPDMVYALCCGVEMLGLIVAIRGAERGRSSTAGAVLAWSAFAVAVLAKGPQLPVFLLAGVLLAHVTRPQPRPSVNATFRPLIGAGILALVAPYFLYVATRAQGAFGVWIHESVQATATPLWLRPLRLYYPFAIVAGLLPWDGALFYAAVRCWRRRPDAAVLVFPILITLVCLSFMGKLRLHYVLPLLPLCAMLVAWAIFDLYDHARGAAAAGDVVGSTVARATVRRLLRAQVALSAMGMLAVAWLASDTNCSGHSMWSRALPLLLIATAVLWWAWVNARDDPARSLGILTLALAIVWFSVSVAGIDLSSRLVMDTDFAKRLAARVPASRPVSYDSGNLEALVYYGRREVRVEKLKNWLSRPASADDKNTPLFVCEKECSADGAIAKGRVLLSTGSCGHSDHMVLFQPRKRGGRRTFLRHSCASDTVLSRTSGARACAARKEHC